MKIELSDRMSYQLPGKDRALIAIDGPSGSGKSTYACKLARQDGVMVVHMDDYFLPKEERKPDWTSDPGSNIDFDRLIGDVLEPFKKGEKIHLSHFDCDEQKRIDLGDMDSGAVLILEGSYSHHPKIAPLLDLKIWLECPEDERIIRLKAREGTGYQAFQKLWVPLEKSYNDRHHIREQSHMVVRNAADDALIK